MAIPPPPPSSAPNGPVPPEATPPEVAAAEPEVAAAGAVVPTEAAAPEPVAPEPVVPVEPVVPTEVLAPQPVMAQPTQPTQPTPSYPAPGAPAQPAAPGYYPQQAYYAPGWTAPASGPGAGAAAVARRNHTRLFLGLAIGLLAALLIAGAATWYLRWNQTRSLGEITGETSASARQVETGHCIADLPDDGSVGSVTLVPCSEPHEAQVVGTYALRFDDWPGQEAVDAEVAASCEMDSAAIADGFRGVVWTPSEGSWSQGDRRGVCIAWHSGGGVTGSFEDGDVQVP